MKKLITLMLILVSLTASAGWVKGTLTYKNNTEKKGYIKYFDNAATKNVDFKLTLEDKSESVPGKELKSVEFQLEDGTLFKMMSLQTATYVGATDKVRIDKGFIWLSVNYSGDFYLLSILYTSANGAYFKYGTSTTAQYYIAWPGDDYAVLTSMVAKSGTLVVGMKKWIKETCKYVFRQKCPKMIEAFNTNTFKPSKVEEIVEFYEQNCHKENQ